MNFIAQPPPQKKSPQLKSAEDFSIIPCMYPQGLTPDGQVSWLPDHRAPAPSHFPYPPRGWKTVA